jgi:adenylate cyclase
MSVFAIGSIVIYRYVHEEKEKEALRRSFEAYFPPLIVEKIMANPDMIASGGQKKELTILFSDIRNFTGYSSSMTPDHVQSLLNEYFEAMTEIVFKYEGTVDKFIGDGLMVFFGDPVPQPDHAIRCVRAAIDMQKKVNEIKKKWVKSGDLPIEIRIGISTGMVIVGNMGSSKRLSYTVLGSDVNLAQRLESNAPTGGILISERTHELIEGLIPTGPQKEIRAKGFDDPVCAYEILI